MLQLNRNNTLPALMILILTASGCGKIGDPLPPIPRAPLVVDELSVTQTGTRLLIRFPVVRPQVSRKLDRIDVYRLIEPVSDPIGLPQDAFSARSTIITTIPVDKIPLNRSVIEYSDPLDTRPGSGGRRYRYAVRMVTADGVTADFSNYATITPIFNLAVPPSGLKAVQSENEIVISWGKPGRNADGSSPANLIGFNIYRRPAGDELIKLNPQPVEETRFSDRNFLFGNKYEYVVRSVSSSGAADGSVIESDSSEALEHSPVDTFPPSAPVSVTIASINGIVSIFWPISIDPDVAGYYVYRSEDQSLPPNQWIKLTPQLHKPASFRDERVQIGKQYFYQITAVDVYGNESARSSTVSEVVAR